eukprot:CAMPEP_0174739916 /NCGR_PEP_ID=MMETSP1094-20130205/72381_1 /TAXON_ID=156173 /ORGANISM="Chrysochromulina brevifilum, Strain UTEX LB 985" /LENGTH=40 /DNA_ID= /DNA_START= /DNA_END= /DNA_ORIENTATION=
MARSPLTVARSGLTDLQSAFTADNFDPLSFSPPSTAHEHV